MGSIWIGACGARQATSAATPTRLKPRDEHHTLQVFCQ